MARIKKPQIILPQYRIPKNRRAKSTREHQMDLLNLGYDVKVIGQYFNLTTPVKYQYPCGHIKEMRPDTMIGSNHGRCIECFPNTPPPEHLFTTEEFVEQISHILPDVTIIGEYIRSDQPIDVVCNKCGHQWSPIAHTLKQGHGCPRCRYLSSRISACEFEKRISSWKYNFVVLDKYNTLLDFYSCRCNSCGKEWKAEGRNLVSGKAGCSNCFTNSRGEEYIRQWLSEHNIVYKVQYKFKELRGTGDRLLSYDFYIPSYNKLIEYQGIQHFQPIDYYGGERSFITQRIHDELKKDYALQHNIDFLAISYKDFNKIDEILTNNFIIESVTTAVG